MLKPFKSFLNNLQKNAIGATFFGILPEMTSNPGEEEEEEIPTDSMYNIDDELDPLADPLALDDDEVVDRTIGSSAGGSDFPSENTTLTDLDNSFGDGQIILVDVNSLKSSFTIPVSYADSQLDIASSSDDKLSFETATQNGNEAGGMDSDITFLECETNASSADDDGIGEVIFEPIALNLDDEITEEVEGARSDGSDSGLGSEMNAGLALDKTNVLPTVVRSNLKRRSDPCDEIDAIDTKRAKRNIQFSGVTVYYFPRIQGFTCVPSQGGCTLGMGPHHYDQKSFSLSEHNAEQKRLHRQQMLEQNPRSNVMVQSPIGTTISTTTTATADDRSLSSTEESDSEEDVMSDNSSSELDTETVGFLQPVSQKQRRALLKAAGVREIASFEKNDCRDIRASREFCGCNCRDYCDPETCFCSRSGIKCQVDRASFPCGCTQDGCGNVIGRIEFNPKRVRTHFIHTIMRLELEKKQKKSDKQNTLNTYDGRLRLRESDDDSSSVTDSSNQHQQSSLGRLITYNPSNNILYPTATIASATNSNSLEINRLTADSNNYNNSNAIEDANQTGVSSIAESPLDLHYAFRNEYPVEITPSDLTQPNYSLYPNSNYFAASSSAATFDDFNNINAPAQSSIIPNYVNFSTNVPYSSLLSNAPTCTTDVIENDSSAATPATTSSCSNYISSYNSANGDCVNINSALFDGTHNDISSPSTSITAINTTNLNIKNYVQYSQKLIEFENGSNKVLDSTADDLNCLLKENLTGPTMKIATSTNLDGACAGIVEEISEPCQKLQSYPNKSVVQESFRIPVEMESKPQEIHRIPNASIGITTRDTIRDDVVTT